MQFFPYRSDSGLYLYTFFYVASTEVIWSSWTLLLYCTVRFQYHWKVSAYIFTVYLKCVTYKTFFFKYTRFSTSSEKKHKPTHPILIWLSLPSSWGTALMSCRSPRIIYKVWITPCQISALGKKTPTFFLSLWMLLELPETATSTSNTNLTIRTAGLQFSLRRFKSVIEAVYTLYW